VAVIAVAGDSESLMSHYVVGDKHATQVLDCLSHIVTVYGQHVIVLQYLHHVRDLVCCRFLSLLSFKNQNTGLLLIPESP